MNSLNLNLNSCGHFGPKIRIKNKVIGAINTDPLNLNSCGHFGPKIRIKNKIIVVIGIELPAFVSGTHDRARTRHSPFNPTTSRH